MNTRAYLLHITHYDPVWVKNKDTETPFDLAVGLEVVDAMADAGLNLLLIDVKDGVNYATHPELARHYTRPMETLHALRDRAARRGIETAVKLNFSQSPLHQHNHWFRPHNDLFDNDEYFRRAFQIIDELIDAVKPPQFFHIGMDEDHSRSYRQYVQAIHTLHQGLAQRKLRTIIWNDTACPWNATEIHRDKSLQAEQLAPKDIIHVVWDYWDQDPTTIQPIFDRVRDAGLELWIAPGARPNSRNLDAMRQAGANAGAAGIVFTRWIPCTPATRDDLLAHLRNTVAPLFA